MKYIYMNEQIRKAKPKRPVIVCQDGNSGGQLESNNFVLSVNGVQIGRVVFKPNGLAECETHEVKAWVELADNVEVTFASLAPAGEMITAEEAAERRVKAHPKDPNKPVVLESSGFLPELWGPAILKEMKRK